MKRLLFALIAAAMACRRAEVPSTQTAPPAPPPATAAPSPERGRQFAAQYGCNVCHVVPGVQGPQGALAPSLAGIASRPLFSNGKVETNADNLAKFIENPAAMNPQSSMPPLSVPTADARDIAAYLETLK